MIPLKVIFDHLRFGELYNVALGGPDCRNIMPDDYPMVASQINMGAIELYKRFALKRDYVQIDLFDEITDYIIHSDYAQSNTASTAPQKWIHDVAEKPYTDNLLHIERVANELDEEFYLNDEHQPRSLYTPAYNIVRHSWPLSTNQIFVHYRAKPDEIDIYDFDLENDWVAVPYTLLEALLIYVGGRVYLNLNPDSQMTAAQLFLPKFEASCRKVKELGLVVDNIPTNEKLDEAGWV